MAQSTMPRAASGPADADAVLVRDRLIFLQQFGPAVQVVKLLHEGCLPLHVSMPRENKELHG